jgi:serine/threonine protein kinase
MSVRHTHRHFFFSFLPSICFRRKWHSLFSFFSPFGFPFLALLFFSTADIVSSAADEISGETVAIKMVTRIFAKTTLAKRALRELTLLRHFSNHENITGLIDVDGIAESFNEMWALSSC